MGVSVSRIIYTVTVITNKSIFLCFVLFGHCSSSLMYIGAVSSFVDSGVMVDSLTIFVFDGLSSVMDNSWLGNNNATGANVCFLFNICVVSKGKLLWLLVGLEVELVVFLIIMVFVAMLRVDWTSVHGSWAVTMSEAGKVTGSIAIEVVSIVEGSVATIWMRSIIRVRSSERMRSSEGMGTSVRMRTISIVQWVMQIAVAISSTWVVISSAEDVSFRVNEIIIFLTFTVTSFATHAADSTNLCVAISAIKGAHAVMVLVRSVFSRNMRAAFPSISPWGVRNAWSWSNTRSTIVRNVAFSIKKIVATREVVERSLASNGAMSSFVGSGLLMPFNASA